MFVVSGSKPTGIAADAALARMRFCVGQKEVRTGPGYLYALNNDIVIAKRHTFSSDAQPVSPLIGFTGVLSVTPAPARPNRTGRAARLS